jgi:hypothetical protein
MVSGIILLARLRRGRESWLRLGTLSPGLTRGFPDGLIVMQDVTSAVKELRRLVLELKLSGAMLPSRLCDRHNQNHNVFCHGRCFHFAIYHEFF